MTIDVKNVFHDQQFECKEASFVISSNLIPYIEKCVTRFDVQ